jgi:PD-(D/E)XK nuclease superfamily
VAQQLDLFGLPGGADAGGGAGAGATPAPDGGAGADAARAGDRSGAEGAGGGGDCAGAAPSVLVVRGPLAAETALLAIVDELTAAARREPALLAAPVRVVVPSRSLRRHVAARLVRPRAGTAGRPGGSGDAQAAATGPGGSGRAEAAAAPSPGRAVAGVAVQTLHGLACEVLERAGVAVPRGHLLFETLVEREARQEPVLRRGLGDLVDGFLAAAPAVADLLDAGFEPEHADALDEALATDGPRAAGRAEVERARALVRVAARTEMRLRRLGAGRRSTVLRLAAEALASGPPERVLPARAVLLHGFARTTGVAADLLRALERWRGATRFEERPAAAAGAVPSAFTALGAEAEAREVARRLRRLLDGSPGRCPEDLAVVARDFSPYRLALRRHLRRLGVPFSGVGERGALLPAGRRAAAVLDLLRWGPEAPADRWLDACALLSPGERVDLRLALGALGAARLRQVAALRDQELGGGLALPVREGVAWMAAGLRAGEPAEAPPPDDDGEGRAVARARRISGRRLAQGVLLAARVHDRLQAWPRRTAARAQLDALRGLMADVGLGDPETAGPLAAAVAELEREVPGKLELASDELRLLLARALGDGGSCPLGGDGGGVQVLSVAEARGRTFDHLFLIGLNRDVFPRPAPEDPLLPDDLRQVLRPLLPDLPLARDGFEDEQQAFAQLLAAAPDVCLSWRAADDDGKPLAASPLVERLMPSLTPLRAPALFSPTAALGPGQVPGATEGVCAAESPGPAPGATDGARSGRPALFSPAAELSPGPAPGAAGGRCMALPAPDAQPEDDVRPADELAVLAGLRGSRQDLGRVLPIALRQVRQELGRPLLELDVEALAAARLRVLDELDPDPRTAQGRAVAARLGPYFGFAGAHPLGSRHPLYVTHLEALVACPWQLFLGRLLRVERPPDPLRALPGADPLRLGILVHRALDRLVQQALAGGAGGEQGEAAAATVATSAALERPAAGATPDRAPVATPDFARAAMPGLATAAMADRAPAATPARVPVPVPWPSAAELEALLGEVAAEVLAEEGLALPGLARALARHALPYVEAARELDWPAGAALPVVASEVEGELPLEAAGGQTRRVRFRADRQDLVNGWLRFTDYKTGKPLAAAGNAAQRRRRLLADVRAGRRLQVVAYVLAAGPGKVIGRYLFLRPDLDAAAREALVEAGDGEARAAFAAAAGTALAAWDAGSFFPRLGATVRRDPPRCTFCTVAEACLRGDPAAHRRLHEWAARAGTTAAPPAGPAEAALLALWGLPAAAGETAAPEAAAAEPDLEGGG